jgi:hypothetical protein
MLSAGNVSDTAAPLFDQVLSRLKACGLIVDHHLVSIKIF